MPLSDLKSVAQEPLMVYKITLSDTQIKPFLMAIVYFNVP